MQICSVRFVSAIRCLTKKPKKKNQVYIQTRGIRSLLLVVNVSTAILVVHMIVILTLCSAIVCKCSGGETNSCLPFVYAQVTFHCVPSSTLSQGLWFLQ